MTYLSNFMLVSYLIGCDNELARLHTRNPDACDKVGGVIIMHIDDLRQFAIMWLHKTEEVRADKAHYAKNITGDIYESGWISEMYGYSFGAAEVYCSSSVFLSIKKMKVIIEQRGRNGQEGESFVVFGRASA